MSTAPQVPIKPQGTKSPKTDFDAYYFVTFEEKYGDKTGTSVGITVYDEKFTPASGPGKHPFYGEKVNRAFEGGFEFIPHFGLNVLTYRDLEHPLAIRYVIPSPSAGHSHSHKHWSVVGHGCVEAGSQPYPLWTIYQPPSSEGMEFPVQTENKTDRVYRLKYVMTKGAPPTFTKAGN